MDALNAILTRRSIRAFLPDPVEDSSLRTLLEAAMFAPSAGNQQSWRFVVIDSREELNAISLEHPHASVLKVCPAAILVCANTHDLPHPDFWPDDCAAAVMNLMLAAHALGLGATWIGLHPIKARMEALHRIAKLPEEVEPFALIPVGHPAERPEQPERFHPEWVRHNSYFHAWEPAKD